MLLAVDGLLAIQHYHNMNNIFMCYTALNRECCCREKNFYLTQGSANWSFVAVCNSSILVRTAAKTGPKYILYHIS